MCDCSFESFVTNNGAFILTFTGLISAGLSACFVFILKSRCSKIEVCCLKCDRDVISEDALPQVAMS